MSEKERGRKKSSFVWIAVGSVLILLIGGVVIYRFAMQSEFDRRVAALSAAGFPVSKEDLEADYVLPEGADNAADVYLEAIQYYYEPNTFETMYLPARGNYIWPDDAPPFEPNVMRALESTLAKNKTCLELADKAARMEHCLWPRKWSVTYFMTDNLSEIKRFAQLLTEEQLYLAQMQRPDEVFESLQTSLSLVQSLRKQPFLIDHLVAMALKALIASSLEDSLNLTAFTEAQLAELQQQFSQMYRDTMMHDAYVTERVCMIEYQKLTSSQRAQYYANTPPSPGSVVSQQLYSASGLEQTDALRILDIHDAMLEATLLPYHEQKAAFENIERRMDMGLFGVFHLSLNMLAGHTRVHTLNLRVIGGIMCAETALGVERYRLAHGALPESLEALVPAFIDTVPLDPGDGKPLRYVLREEGGYTIYSIGPDGVDHGGLDLQQMRDKGQKNPSENRDWPFTVKR